MTSRARAVACGWESIRALPSEAAGTRPIEGLTPQPSPSASERPKEPRLPRARHQAQRQGLSGILDRLQAAYRRGRRWDSARILTSFLAIPLATMTAERVTNLYDLMDAAYDAAEIRAHSESLGHVPIIDVNPRNNSATFKQELKQEAKAKRTLGQPYAKDVRYRERSTVRQRSAEGRVRRPAGTCARPQQGAVPPDVRGPGVDRGPVAALGELKTRLRSGHIPPVPKLFAGR